MQLRIVIGAAMFVASTGYAKDDAEPPRSEVHIRSFHLKAHSSNLTEKYFINDEEVTSFDALHRSPFLTRVKRVQSDAPLRVEVTAKYRTRKGGVARRVVESNLIWSGGTLGSAVGWAMFAEGHQKKGCAAHVEFEPEKDARYLVEYRYLDDGRCLIRCRQVLSDINVANPESSLNCDGTPFKPPEATDERATLGQHLEAIGIEIEPGPLGARVSASNHPDVQTGDIITRLGYVDFMDRGRSTTEFTPEHLKDILLGANRRLIIRLVRNQRDEMTVPISSGP